MPWIDDVVSHTTIRSVWGNTIRDHVTHVVGSKAERDATVVPTEGMRVYCSDTRITYVRVGSTWWVESMPAVDFTPRAWLAVTLPTFAELSVTAVTVAKWQQSMGRCWVRASYQASPGAVTNVNAFAFFYVPVSTSAAGGVGQARVYTSNTGLTHGGAAGWYDHVASGSRCIVNGVAGAPANAVINVPSGATLNFDVDAQYLVDPARDS